MMIGRLCLVLLLAYPFAAFAQKKQIQELQRDMALMQDEVRTMNEKLTNLTMMVEQLAGKVNSTNTTVTVLDASVKDSLKEQQREIAVPIAAMGSKVDQLTNEFRFVRESVSDLNSRVGKIQTQLTDLKTATQVMSAPPPPPAAGGAETPFPAGTTASPAAGQMPSASPAGMTPPQTAGGAAVAPGSAETLYNNARRDQSGGKLDLALMEYQDFLRFHPNSDLAPAVQFHIGEIYYTKGDFEAAVQAFDLVLEKYPANRRTADAMFMKAQSFTGAGQNRQAAREYRALMKTYPDSGLAQRAREELAKLGY